MYKVFAYIHVQHEYVSYNINGHPVYDIEAETENSNELIFELYPYKNKSYKIVYNKEKNEAILYMKKYNKFVQMDFNYTIC